MPAVLRIQARTSPVVFFPWLLVFIVALSDSMLCSFVVLLCYFLFGGGFDVVLFLTFGWFWRCLAQKNMTFDGFHEHPYPGK